MELLERLEVSIQNFKSLELIIDYRIEAEYFDKRFLKIDNIISKKNNIPFFDVADYENGRAYGSDYFSESFIENGIKVSKIGDVTQKRLNENWVWVSKLEFIKQKGNYLVDDDILMTLTGDPPDIGKVNLFKKNELKSTWNQRVARIFLKESQHHFYSNKTFFIILYNRFCREQLERYAKGIRQRNLGTECIERLRLPLLKKDFQIKLDFLITKSFENLESSKLLYTQAETLLLQEIGLDGEVTGLNPVAVNTNVKSFKESFGVTGRLDAEYYQPKYDNLIEIIKSYENGYTSLETLIDNYSTGFPYKSETYCDRGIPLIRINNISKGNLDLSNAANIPFEDITLSEKDIAVENDILISMSGTIGNSCRIPKGIKAVVNQRIMRFTPKDFDSEVLSLLINSIVGYSQLERIGTGGVQTNISATDIKNILIPKIKENKQQEIAQLIQESFSLKKQSEHLLEVAKKAVEMAIEESEEVAMKFIDENIQHS